jgi:hypothetical protein
VSGRTLSLPAVAGLLDSAADACRDVDPSGVELLDAPDALRSIDVITYEARGLGDRLRAACERAGVNGTPVPHPVKPLPLPKEPPPPPPAEPEDGVVVSLDDRRRHDAGRVPTNVLTVDVATTRAEHHELVVAELRVLREIVRAAGPAHDQLPPIVQRGIEIRGVGESEILRLSADLAGYSPATRQRLEATLTGALDHLTAVEKAEDLVARVAARYWGGATRPRSK